MSRRKNLTLAIEETSDERRILAAKFHLFGCFRRGRCRRLASNVAAVKVTVAGNQADEGGSAPIAGTGTPTEQRDISGREKYRT